MTTPRDLLPKASPLVQKKKTPPPNGAGTNSMLSLATMLVSLAVISIALASGLILIFDILEVGIEGSMDTMPVKIIVLGFTFFFGWGIGLVCIRAFGNRIYPIIIKLYTWGCLIAASTLYIKIIQKLYKQEYSNLKLGMYVMIMLGVLFVLLFLHLLLKEQDPRPFSIPLLIISVGHLLVIVYHYVLADNVKAEYLPGDFMVFLQMTAVAGLMLMNTEIISPIRERINDIFEKKPEPENNNNGNGTKVS